MDKAERDAERAAIMAAYERRVISGDRDLQSGLSAAVLMIVLFQLCFVVVVFFPQGLFTIYEAFYGASGMLRGFRGFFMLFGHLYFFVRIGIPVAADVVWRMDILSNKMGLVRRSEVLRLFMLSIGQCRDDLTLLHFRRNHV